MLDILAAGFLIGLTHAMPPGPITFEVLKRGISEGLPSALKVDVGAVAADSIFFVLIVAGLSQVIDHSPGRLAMWLGGCVLLVFLGLRGIYQSLLKKPIIDTETARGSSPLVTGFLICITSPFAIVWWVGVFAGTVVFLNGMIALLSMFGGIALACLLWYALVGVMGSASKKVFRKSWMTWLSRVCSLVMIGFGVILFYRGYTTFL